MQMLHKLLEFVLCKWAIQLHYIILYSHNKKYHSGIRGIYIYYKYIYHDGFRQRKNPFYYDYSITITFTIPIVKSTTAVIVVLYLYHIS